VASRNARNFSPFVDQFNEVDRQPLGDPSINKAKRRALEISTLNRSKGAKAMKVIGLIGGVSWESSAEYYRLLNQAVKLRAGPLHSTELVMYSLDFQPIAQLEHEEKWDELAEVLIAVTRRLEAAGVNFVLVASNTLHKVAAEIQAQVTVPLLHIADAVGEEVCEAKVAAVGLLGTNFVMEQNFYRKRLESRGIKTFIPPKGARNFIHDVIYKELAVGEKREASKIRALEIIEGLGRMGAQGIVLACTELPLLIRPEDTPIRVFDSMAIHVSKAVSLALSEGSN
jgi:aspartate racemase